MGHQWTNRIQEGTQWISSRQDPEIKQWLHNAAATHQAHVEALVDQMRRHSGRERKQTAQRPDA